MSPCDNTSQSTTSRLAIIKHLEEARQTAPRDGQHRAKGNAWGPQKSQQPQNRSRGHYPSPQCPTKVTIKPSLSWFNSSKAKAASTATNVVVSSPRTTSSASSVTLLNPPQNESQKTSQPTANRWWWWCDIVFKKANLEECTGEKYERLLLAFSIRTLMGQSIDKSHEYRLSQAFIGIYSPQTNLKDLR